MKIRCFLLWLSTVEVGNQDEKKLCLFTVKMFAQSIYCNDIDMSYFAYACKTEGKNGISHLISELLHTLDSSLRDRLFVLQNEVF